MIAININPKDFEKATSLLSAFPKELRGALWQSVKRSLTSLKKELATQIEEESFLNKSIINKAITKPQMYGSARRGNLVRQTDSIMGALRVSSRRILADKYKLIPAAVTAKRGIAIKKRKVSAFAIGPNKKVWKWGQDEELSTGFIVRGRKSGKLRYVRRWLDRDRTHPLYLVFGPPVHYFAAFTKLQNIAFTTARTRFEKTLEHEINYRLGKLGAK